MLAWLAATHVLAAVGVLAMGLAVWVDVPLLAALVAHLCWHRPAAPLRVVRNKDGFWSVPDAGLAGLRLAPASRYGGWWVDLRLHAARRRVRVLLLRDQLDAASWRLLQATLRRDWRSRALS